MKKIFLCLILILALFVGTVSLSGCNKQIFDFDFTFDHAYLKIGEEWKVLEIASWRDYEGEQYQIKLKDGTTMVVSSVYCILYRGELPNGI